MLKRHPSFKSTVILMLSTMFIGTQIYAQDPGPTREILLGNTFFDFIEGQGRKIAQATSVGSDGLHFVFDRQAPSSSFRSIAYDYYDKSAGLIFGNQDLGGGTNSVLTNTLNDAALVAFRDMGNVILMQDLGEANFYFTTLQSIPNALAVGLAGHSNKVVLSTPTFTNPLEDNLRISYDGFGTWINSSFPSPDPLTTDNGTIASAILNPLNAQEFSFLLAPNSTAAAPNGSLIQITTTDDGTTWTKAELHNDDTVYPGDLTYEVENFADINGIYDAQGNFHVVAGAIQGTINQNQPIFPILYWNYASTAPSELTDSFYGRNPDSTVQDGLISLRPGNGLGNAYPQIARVGSDYLFVAWQQWEANPDGSLRTIVGTAGEEIFATDIWGCFLTTAGVTSNPFKIAGQAGVSDVFPRLPETLEIKTGVGGDSLQIELIYLRDTDPGVSSLGQNNESLCDWIFARQSLAIPITGIEQSKTPLEITDFSLYQNYPNPFNPSTTISYSLRKRGQVTIDVFDITGSKITTLVDQIKPAGEHNTRFEAENLPSGLYFYTISSSGIRLDSKKMILIK